MTAHPDLPPCHPAAELFPMLEPKELKELADDIAANGQHQPIIYTADGLLLDGRNRWRACQQIGVQPTSELYTGDTPTHYVISLNSRRRHLKPGQLAMIASDARHLLEGEARSRMAAGGRSSAPGRPADEKGLANGPTVSETPPDEPFHTREVAAKMVGASGRSVGRADRVKAEAPELADRVRTGDLSLGSAEEQLKQRQAARQAAEHRDQVMAEVPADQSGPDWWMFHGGIGRLADLPDGSVDLVVTAAPEPAVFLPQAPELAQHAARLLGPDGVLVVAVDTIFLPKVVEAFASHLVYGWTYCEPLAKPVRIHPRDVSTGWRAWLAFTPAQWPVGAHAVHSDVLEAPLPDLIAGLCAGGGAVLDPYAGAGGAGVAALGAGRRFIGCEADPALYRQAVETLGEVS